jgi:hypothetical protein
MLVYAGAAVDVLSDLEARGDRMISASAAAMAPYPTTPKAGVINRTGSMSRV